MFLSEGHEFPSAPCLARGGKKNMMAARVSMLLKSRTSLTCFRACLLPGRAKDLSAPRTKTLHIKKQHNKSHPHPQNNISIKLLLMYVLVQQHNGQLQNQHKYTENNTIKTREAMKV